MLSKQTKLVSSQASATAAYICVCFCCFCIHLLLLQHTSASTSAAAAYICVYFCCCCIHLRLLLLLLHTSASASVRSCSFSSPNWFSNMCTILQLSLMVLLCNSDDRRIESGTPKTVVWYRTLPVSRQIQLFLI